MLSMGWQDGSLIIFFFISMHHHVRLGSQVKSVDVKYQPVLGQVTEHFRSLLL